MAEREIERDARARPDAFVVGGRLVDQAAYDVWLSALPEGHGVEAIDGRD